MPTYKSRSKDTGATDGFCRSCESPQNPQSREVVETGDESTNIGVGNIRDTNIHVGDYHAASSSEVNADPQLKNDLRLPVQNLWLMTIGLFGSIASLLSLFFDVEPLKQIVIGWPLLAPILFAVSLPLLYLGFDLCTSEYPSPLPFSKRVIYRDCNDWIHVAEVEGTCPAVKRDGEKCGERLRVVLCREDGEEVQKLACSEHPEQHRYPLYVSELSTGQA